MVPTAPTPVTPVQSRGTPPVTLTPEIHHSLPHHFNIIPENERNDTIACLTKNLGEHISAIEGNDYVVKCGNDYLPDWFAKLSAESIPNTIAGVKKLMNALSVRQAKSILLYNDAYYLKPMLEPFETKTLLMTALKLRAYELSANDPIVNLLKITDDTSYQNVQLILNSSPELMFSLGLFESISCAYRLTGYYSDTKEWPFVPTFSGKFQVMLNIISESKEVNNPIIRMLFEKVDYKKMHLKENCSLGADILAELSKGSPLKRYVGSEEEITNGNKYVARVFWDVMRDVLGYGHLESIYFLDLYLTSQTKNEFRNMMCECIAEQEDELKTSETILATAHEQMTGKATVNALQTYSNKQSGACGYPAYSQQYVQYIFSAMRRRLDKLKNSSPETQQDIKRQLSTAMGLLIQGYNNCAAGVNKAHEECVSMLLPTDDIDKLSWKDCLKAAVCSTIFKIKEELFKFKSPKNLYLSPRGAQLFDADNNIKDDAVEMYKETSMGETGINFLLNGMYGIDKADQNTMTLVGGNNSFEDIRQFLLIYLLNAKKHSEIVEKAWQSLRDNPETAQWGPGGSRQFRWAGYDLKNGATMPYLYESIFPSLLVHYYSPLGDVMYGTRVHDYKSSTYNNYSMKFYEYQAVVKQLLAGVIGDTEFMVSLLLKEPLTELAFDKFFSAHGVEKFKLSRDFKPNVNSSSPVGIAKKIREEKIKFLAMMLRDHLSLMNIH
ncbi:MAG: hypothetical protein LBT70_03670 [Holosporaceae bacterium]|nr:hypothetical protein [Holosporaceae bacterium]